LNSSNIQGSLTGADGLDLRLVGILLRKNYRLILILPVVSAVIGYFIASNLSPKYKSLATVGIQASYFQNPLINDLVVQVADPAELQSQRLSLLKLALDTQFLDFLATRFEQYKTPPNTRERALEREAFTQKIVYFPAGSTTFQLSVVAGDPLVAQSMNQDLIAQIRETLVTQRYQTLANVRSAVKEQLVDLSTTLAVPVPVSKNELTEEDVLKRERDSLLRKFTSAHPRVVELSRQLGALHNRRPNSESSVEAGQDLGVPSLSKLPFNRRPLEEVYAELAKKLNYLNVVMGMEQDRSRVDYFTVVDQPSLPLRQFFPSKRNFSAAGAAIGLSLVLIWLTFEGTKLNREFAVSKLADALELLPLGELPALPHEDRGVLKSIERLQDSRVHNQ
jgi:hypothetical protein